eukprot:CAMPEP_0198680696 /NCGR_PEP_ID=MMETSP1468-20131203/5329_1 /TAXON_ID=1461545 /ORGANISM="Mantoniella sp, Strain CCMP1436" /LENGTH=464 /DNA_ID=CAMNT_0044421339 /DNA_START=49 /DNA_END=1443 /DNA_ORIENTATION=+
MTAMRLTAASPHAPVAQAAYAARRTSGGGIANQRASSCSCKAPKAFRTTGIHAATRKTTPGVVAGGSRSVLNHCNSSARTFGKHAARSPSARAAFFNLFGNDGAEDDSKQTRKSGTEGGVSYDLLGLDSGTAGAVDAAAAVFERVDDVVMGGVSSSAMGPDLAGRDCLVWAGKCRVQGGGFAGARSVALKTPLDLSTFDGIAMSCGFESDDEPQRRTWKATVRTQNNRGEVVYQATFMPPVADKTKDANAKPEEIRIPWESFRLVRGPVVVPDVPPLSADQCSQVFGLGLIMSRFGPQGPMPDFREGPFRLALHSLGVFSSDTAAAATAAKLSPPQTLSAAVAGNAGKKKSENRGTRTVLTFLLSPLIALVFSEKGRRRKMARAMLKKRYDMGELKARFAYGQRLKAVRTGSAGAAAAEGLTELVRDAAAAVLTLPLRGLFILVSKLAQVVRKLKGQKALPPMK